MVIGALALVLGWMLAVRRLPGLRRRFGAVLHDCDRRSCGELYFACGIAFLLLLTPGEPLKYAIAVLTMTFADAAAAIFGRLLPSTALTGPVRDKTVAGCAAFFVTALLACALPLAVYAERPYWQLGVAAVVFAVATTLVEALSRRGLDNLAVPVAAWLVLTALELCAGPATDTVREALAALRFITGGHW